MMGAVYRRAMRKDANRLHDIRRRSILELAPPTMPAAEAQAWAERLTLSGMERKLRELEVWVAELDGTVAGWGAIRGDLLEGLYTAPEFAGQGRLRRIARQARRADARARVPLGAPRGKLKRPRFLPSSRLPDDRSANI
jgi:hypothetical protein